MNITHYSRKTGEALDVGLADKDPKNEGGFLIPAFATPSPLPEVSENECAVYRQSNGSVPRAHTDGQWQVVADFRGYIGFDSEGVQHKINELGITPDESWTTERPFIFAEGFELKNNEIRQAFSMAMQPITATYTAEDIASFPTQEAEAKAYEADPEADTPLLDFMVANRPSVDKPTLVSRILANSVIYKQVAGPAIGKKQHFEDLLYALKAQHDDPQQPDVTQADFDAIVVDFS